MNITKSKLLLATSALAMTSMALAQSAKADSISDLKMELNIIQSQIKDMQAQSHHYTPAKKDELAQIKHEVAELKTQIDQQAKVAAAPPPMQTATANVPSIPAVTENSGVTIGGGMNALPANYQRPVVGGIPLVVTHGGAFFIAGDIDAGLRVDSGAGHSIVSVQSGLMRASRLTLEGYQAVPFGLRVVGVIEGGLNIAKGLGTSNPSAAGNGFDFGRESFVGIGSDKTGYIDFGRQYSPIWAVSAAPWAEPFAGNYLGGMVAFDPTMAVNSRVSNAITYNYGYTWEGMLDPSPRTGFGFAALFAPGGQTGYHGDPTNAGQQFGASASYGTNKWWVGAGYDQIDGWNSDVAPYSNTYIPSTSNKTALTEVTLAGSYVLPIARLFAQYNMQTDHRKSAIAGGVEQDDWLVGFVAPTFTNQNLRFSYGQFYNHNSTKAQYSMYQASYEYDLVKAPGTALYLEGLVVANNHNSAQGIIGAANVGGTGPAAILPDQLTADGTTLDYGATSSTVAAGVRFIF